MRVFVFTYDRYDTLTTPMMLEEAEADYTVLCHTEEAKQKFLEVGRVNSDRLIATGQPKGLANNRNWALDQMEEGEWAMFLVDDFIKIKELDDYDEQKSGRLKFTMKQSGEYGRKFKKEISMAKFLERAQEDIRFAETASKGKITLIGWSAYENPFYRQKKYRTNILADGRALAVRKTEGLTFDLNAQSIDDYGFTARTIARGKTVLVNAWILPDCKRYTKGAYGTKDERMEQRKKECAYLVKTYPNIVSYKDKAGFPFGTHVVVRVKNRARSK